MGGCFVEEFEDVGEVGEAGAGDKVEVEASGAGVDRVDVSWVMIENDDRRESRDPSNARARDRIFRIVSLASISS